MILNLLFDILSPEVASFSSLSPFFLNSEGQVFLLNYLKKPNTTIPSVYVWGSLWPSSSWTLEGGAWCPFSFDLKFIHLVLIESMIPEKAPHYHLPFSCSQFRESYRKKRDVGGSQNLMQKSWQSAKFVERKFLGC